MSQVTFYHALGQRIRMLRMALDMTHLELGCVVWMPPWRISEIERGVTTMQVNEIGLFCDALGVTADQLLGRKE